MVASLAPTNSRQILLQCPTCEDHVICMAMAVSLFVQIAFGFIVVNLKKADTPMISLLSCGIVAIVVLLPMLRYCGLERNERIGQRFSHLGLPLLLESPFLTCGILGAVGKLSGHTVGVVNYAGILGIFLITAVYLLCIRPLIAGCMDYMSREREPLVVNSIPSQTL